MPAITSGVLDLEAVASTGPAFGAAQLRLRLGRMPDSDLQAYVLDAPWLFDRPGNPYLGPNGLEWQDNPQRFAAFGWAAAHLAYGDLDPGWQADILHCHDWHTGLAPAYLEANPASAASRPSSRSTTLPTRDTFRWRCSEGCSLPAAVLNADGLEFHGQGNFMKSGLVFSDCLTTVSPRYAQEIRTPEFGSGHDRLLSARGDKLSGILNGVDYEVWDSGTDRCCRPTTPRNRCRPRPSARRRCRPQPGWRPTSDAPLFAVVITADRPEGHRPASWLPACAVADGRAADRARHRRALPAGRARRGGAGPSARQCMRRFSYDEEMAHRMVAAADVILVPSRFEPCGLTQMYGLRYGTVPLVRRVGGPRRHGDRCGLRSRGRPAIRARRHGSASATDRLRLRPRHSAALEAASPARSRSMPTRIAGGS